jgi:hypothetical protein
VHLAVTDRSIRLRSGRAGVGGDGVISPVITRALTRCPTVETDSRGIRGCQPRMLVAETDPTPRLIRQSHPIPPFDDLIHRRTRPNRRTFQTESLRITALRNSPFADFTPYFTLRGTPSERVICCPKRAYSPMPARPIWTPSDKPRARMRPRLDPAPRVNSETKSRVGLLLLLRNLVRTIKSLSYAIRTGSA